MHDDSNSRDDERTRATVLIGELVPTVLDIDPPSLGRSDEWWEQRTREIHAQQAKEAARAEQNRLIERAGELDDNGFPAMAVAAARAELADTIAMRFARTFVSIRAHGLCKRLLVLAGGVGAGKTTAATWVALMGKDPRPGFIRASSLERRGRYDRKLEEWLEDKTSLVIDDVGTEVLDGKGVFRSLLDDTIDKFYSDKRTLVMTTNLRPRRARVGEPGHDPNELEQFAERYGDRVASRLVQLGEWGDCGTRDLRREPQP